MSHSPAQRSARQAAIKWFVIMQDADTEHPERSRFEEWLLSHPAHQRAYQEVCALWEDLDSSDRLLHLESAMQQKIFIEKTDRSKKIRTAITRTLSVMFFAALGITSYYGYESWQNEPTMHMAASTEIGQIRSQVLEDGTKLMVNANSDIEVTYTRKERRVILKRGEASFDVAKNPDRPFVVDSGLARITVLGTRFAVNKFSSKVRISVDHGVVRIEPQQYLTTEKTAPNRFAEHVLTLRDNEVAEINLNGEAKRLQRPAADAFSFEYGTITFDQAGLEEIAETLSRYRPLPVNADLDSQPDVSITAVIQSKYVERFIKELPAIAPVKVTTEGDITLLTPKKAQASRKQ
ncbi:FecR family protein [Methylobacillus pratensis]